MLLLNIIHINPEIRHRGFHIMMSHHVANGNQVTPRLQQVMSKTRSKHMREFFGPGKLFIRAKQGVITSSQAKSRLNVTVHNDPDTVRAGKGLPKRVTNRISCRFGAV